MDAEAEHGAEHLSGLTVAQAAALAAVTERTVRNWIKAGHLAWVPMPEGRRIERNALLNFLRDRALAAVEQVPPEARPVEDSVSPTERERGTAASSVESAEPISAPLEAQYRVTPAEIERAVAATSAQYMGDLRTMLAEVGKVYEGHLAAQQETIAELRRRAEVAEADAEGLRLRLAEGSVPPVLVVAGQEATEAVPGTETTSETQRPVQRLWRRLRRVWRRG